ncbi:MAG: MmcQ/YjbR family DNA-binding protein [Candidatus Marinimicrobia bacterium]|nr:MmcQ/YjbR family DNA-binding protein [Candidatus Neomarinimicrobiota bacterium]
MDFQQLKSYLLSKPGCTETYPFGPDPMVAKVGDKIFALVSIDSDPCCITIKCDPADAQIQRSMYDSIQPGYHMNKEHWNTITMDQTIPNNLFYQLVDDSYHLVLSKLSKKMRNLL